MSFPSKKKSTIKLIKLKKKVKKTQSKAKPNKSTISKFPYSKKIREARKRLSGNFKVPEIENSYQNKSEFPPQAVKVKEFLYKSKEIVENETNQIPREVLNSLEINNEPITSVVDQSVLLGEKSSWKKRDLEEDSLMHLLVLEILYSRFFLNNNDQENFKSIDSFFNNAFLWLRENHFFSLNQNLPLKFKTKAKVLVKEIIRSQDNIIAEISPFLIKWKWERLPPIRQYILITSWYFIKKKPEEVLAWLNDAINHAKWFGEEKEYAFVNSILDKLITYHRLWGEVGKTSKHNSNK